MPVSTTTSWSMDIAGCCGCRAIRLCGARRFSDPVPNTGAYSDILLGVAPLYWPWRVAGFAPDTSYQLWMLTVVSFNYVAAVVCCRRLLKVDWPAAAIGSFVFAFGSSRIAQIGHAQLLGQFYWLLALYAIARCFQLSADRSDPRMNATRSSRWIGSWLRVLFCSSTGATTRAGSWFSR